MTKCYYDDGDGYCSRNGRRCPYSTQDEEECPHYDECPEEDNYWDDEGY